MSKVLNETPVYPGWEIRKTEMTVEEKALLIKAQQDYVYVFAKVGASAGILFSLVFLFNRYSDENVNFNISEMLTLIALFVFAGGLTGYLSGHLFAWFYRK